MLHRPFALIGDTRHGTGQTRGHQVRAADRGQPMPHIRQARPPRGVHFLPGNGGILRGDAGRCAPISRGTRAYHGRRSALTIAARIERRKFHSRPATLIRFIDPGREHQRPGSCVFKRCYGAGCAGAGSGEEGPGCSVAGGAPAASAGVGRLGVKLGSIS
jgi:hypothetical protein